MLSMAFFNNQVNHSFRLEFELIWDFMPVLDTSKFGEDPIKHDRKNGDATFPIISHGELFVVRTPTVLIKFTPKPNAASPPHPIDATHKSWPRLTNWS